MTSITNIEFKVSLTIQEVEFLECILNKYCIDNANSAEILLIRDILYKLLLD